MGGASIDDMLKHAIAHHQSGRLREAEQIYRQILARQPNQPEATHFLGVIATEVGQLDAGVQLLETAALLDPSNPEVHGNLGCALRSQGRLDDAVLALNRSIALSPQRTESHFNLGLTLSDQGKFAEAVAAYSRAIDLWPKFAPAHGAIANALWRAGQADEALASYRQAIALDPKSHEAYNNLANALTEKEDFEGAIAACRHAINLQPDHAESYAHLGSALRGKGLLEEAIAAHRRAIALNPNLGQAHHNLGNALKDCGRLDESIACYRKAMQFPSSSSSAHSNLVLAMQYHPGYDANAISQELRRWNDAHAAPLKKFIQPVSNIRDPDRRLRIGYVSADFRDHVVGRNILPLLRHHDHQKFQIFCYSNDIRDDVMTEQFRTYTDHWRSIAHLSDTEAAALIRQDQIDILVDLALHTSGNRLKIFARKPAPVQVTFAGYPGSTGVETIDYRLTDPQLDPPGFNPSIYSEQSYHLPNCFWCYDGPDVDLHPNVLPALSNGYITFGCLNNLCKVTGPALQLWAHLLNEVPQSRLLLLCPDAASSTPTLQLLGEQGINPNRVDFVHRRPHGQYLEHYRKIDIGLDTFPYNGHTTSLDAFWMGVPVVTLVGRTIVGRAGLSQMSNLGLQELVAETPEQYVTVAAQLASDIPRLSDLHHALRSRMQASPLTDKAKFAASIEGAYRFMWRKWCERKE
jgi:predicted O-linked N-acetylglucosamine transferase (SPINDLY family)